jgi:hypothetical protein
MIKFWRRKPPLAADEPKPPWVVSKSIFPGDDPYWQSDAGRAWLRNVFLPFYDSLSMEDQIAYRSRWNAPTSWVTLFLHPDLDELMADAYAELDGKRVEPLNFRKIFLDQAKDG